MLQYVFVFVSLQHVRLGSRVKKTKRWRDGGIFHFVRARLK